MKVVAIFLDDVRIGGWTGGCCDGWDEGRALIGEEVGVL